MPGESQIIFNLVAIVIAAALGGLVAVRFKQPVILGYLLAGVVIGPFTPGPQATFEGLRFVAEFGVALLLFVMGAGISLAQFKSIGPVVLAGGALQIALTILLGFGLAPLLGMGLAEGFLLGTILAQSSSAVIIKITEDRDETGSVHGRIAVGMSMVQDVTSGPLLLALVVFLGGEARGMVALLTAVGEVAVLAVVAFVLGRLALPRFLHWISGLHSPELTLLTTLAIALGSGLVLSLLGLSFAIGAFLAGIAVAEAVHHLGSIARILPLRDVFTAVFFVSIGMLFDPASVTQQPLVFLALLAAVIVGKGAISIGAISLFRYPVSTALLGGILLAQMGEFAFVVAEVGIRQGVLSHSMFSLIIAAAIGSIALNSLVMESVPRALAAMSRPAFVQEKGIPSVLDRAFVNPFRRMRHRLRNGRAKGPWDGP